MPPSKRLPLSTSQNTFVNITSTRCLTLLIHQMTFCRVILSQKSRTVGASNPCRYIHDRGVIRTALVIHQLILDLGLSSDVIIARYLVHPTRYTTFNLEKDDLDSVNKILDIGLDWI